MSITNIQDAPGVPGPDWQPLHPADVQRMVEEEARQQVFLNGPSPWVRLEDSGAPSAILQGFNSKRHFTDEEAAERAEALESFEGLDAVDPGYFDALPDRTIDVWPVDRPEPIVTLGDVDLYAFDEDDASDEAL